MRIKFLVPFKSYKVNDIISIEKFYTENDFDVDLLKHLYKIGYIEYINKDGEIICD